MHSHSAIHRSLACSHAYSHANFDVKMSRKSPELSLPLKGNISRNRQCHNHFAVMRLLRMTMIFLTVSVHHVQACHVLNLPEQEHLLTERECIPPYGFSSCSESALMFPGRQVNVTVLLPFDPYYKASLKRVAQAIYLGFQKTREMHLLPNYQILLSYKNSNCSNVYAPLTFAEDVFHERAHVFFGPSCELALAPVARWLKFFNTPLLTAGALTSDYTDNKKSSDSEYFLTTRTGFSFEDMVEFIMEYFKTAKWKKTMLMYDKDEMSEVSGLHTCKYFMTSVVDSLKKNTYQFGNFDLKTNNVNASLKEILAKELGLKYSVVILCASPPKVREILLAAEELKMVSSGEYVFFNVELFTNLKKGYKPWLNPNDTKENNDRAKLAYEALLTVTVRPPPDSEEYLNFDKEVKELALKKFNFSFGDEPVNPFVTAFYDAVILYATALNETLNAGGSISNGTEITRRMWDRTIQGITGNVSINDNGDRNAEYSLLDMDPEKGWFHVVAHYKGGKGKEKSIVEVEGRKIHWPGGRTTWPPDTPKCGFDGQGCPTMPKYVIVVIALSSALVIMLISLFFIYRHYKLEAEIASMTWKVNINDVLTTGGSNTRGSRWSLASHRNSLLSNFSGDSLLWGSNKQLFVKTVFYKNSVVAIKKINKSRIELTRPLLLELKRMKDLHHEHLVRFIGASVDVPHCFLLTEYCPRGSLQDILENEQLKLDWTFRYSLMHDIVKAMHYLHNSEIRSHGNLKSSNCVVDSRFVLKVADFGLHSLRGVPEDAEDHDSYAYWRRKLWTAPELLRMAKPPPEGTQKGDVYSFSIIVHEIAARQGSFYTAEEFTPEEIVRFLREGETIRPCLDIDECDDEMIELMKRCWQEDPIERPDFGQIKATIRRLNKVNERGPTLVDNLLARMEQYANNLETLVQERTADYLEEKRKCEEVLYQLLPKSVATSLIAGQNVSAETFESVTIYFSDIVGFTSLSAESTPMEVVTLLNDLYTCFDSIIENFDVYKVETIGDAYMVVSGLPVKNGITHAREIARMALALRDAVLRFTIRHRPTEQLKLRIGMHTGSVAAGVVGQKMPRYCLFGDTVNTASRMESNGQALKIHVSSATKKALDHFKTFDLELRGEVEMKGKGKMTTYWLRGEKPATDLQVDTLDSSEATVSNDAVSVANVSITTANTNAVPLISSANGNGNSNLATSGTNLVVVPPTCTSPDNNRSRERQSVCFDKDIPNSVIIDPNNRRASLSKEHQQETNNISKSASKSLIEA